jgi:hypothetical protein
MREFIFALAFGLAVGAGVLWWRPLSRQPLRALLTTAE